MEHYSLPLIKRSSLKWYLWVLLIFSTLATLAGSIFLFVSIMKDDFITGLLMGLFMLAICIFFAYILVIGVILKRFYIEITTEYIRVSIPFKSKTVYWREVYETQLFRSNGNISVSVLLKEDIYKKRRRTIANNFNSLYGIPPYSFLIPLTYFKDVDAKRLLLTIEEQIKKVRTKDEVNIENLYDDYEEKHNSIIKALIISVLSCVIMSIIYGFSIYKLKENFVVLPILGCYLIISVFNKYYLEESFNMFIRFILGLICLVQVPAGIIAATMFLGKFGITDIFIVTVEYFKYLVQEPLKQILIILIAIICFVFGLFKGRVNKSKAKLDI